MEGISSYVLAIVGSVLLSFAVELVLPEGQMAKYARGAVGFVTVLIVLSPVPNLLSGEWKLESVPYGEIAIDEPFLQFVEDLRLEQAEEALEEVLLEQDIDADIRLYAENGEVFAVECYLRNPVINGEKENILVSEEARKALAKVCEIDESKVIVYG